MPTLVVKRLVTPGAEKEYENKMGDFIDHVERMDGYMGANIARPSNKNYPMYVFTARFDTKKHLETFKQSEIRKQYLKELHNISQAPIRERTIDKLDWWFALPGSHYEVPQYKMFILSAIAVYPIVFVINFLFDPQQDLIMLAIKTLFVVTITIAVMSYITLPFLLVCFKGWLYPPTR